jgi:hypothetical protein
MTSRRFLDMAVLREMLDAEREEGPKVTAVSQTGTSLEGYLQKLQDATQARQARAQGVPERHRDEGPHATVLRSPRSCTISSTAVSISRAVR